MSVHLEMGIAENCVGICDSFVEALQRANFGDKYSTFGSQSESFDTARQIGAVYELFAGEDLRSLLDGFVDQARAMSMLFAAAGGLIEAQDEALASALGRAAAEPAGLQSLGVMSSLSMVAAGMQLPEASLPSLGGGYDRVGPEDVSGASLEWMATGARALDGAQFREVATRVGSVADTLESAAGQLQSGLSDVLGGAWQGEFATRATSSVTGLTSSATELAGALRAVAGKAEGAANGFTVTRQNVGSEASTYELVQQRTPGSGLMMGPASETQQQELAAARAAAEEQARAVMNTEYSPAVMDANLSGLEFPTAYRVVSSAGLGGPSGVDLAAIWNEEGVISPAVPGVPSESAVSAITGGGPAGGGAAAPEMNAMAGVAGGVSTATGGGGAAVPVDAGTQQALLGVREGAGTGAAAGGAVPGGAGAPAASPAGVNAGTAAAAAGSPLMAAGAHQSGGATGTARARTGGRSPSPENDRRDRGFGSAAGLVGGGGAAAAGAGAASRMGGAGTLSGVGGPAAPLAPPATSTGAAGAPAAPSSSTSNASGARMGAMPMGMMGAAGAAGRNDRGEGHRPASYLVNATNASEIVGEPVKVSPAKIGALPDAAPAPEPTPTPESPAQALVNKIKGR